MVNGWTRRIAARLADRLFRYSLTVVGAAWGSDATGNRAYATLMGADPSGDVPPIYLLEIDDLNVGRPVSIRMSPKQVHMLCSEGKAAVEQQCARFALGEPVDYDVRGFDFRWTRDRV